MDATAILEKALNRIRTDGWWQSNDSESALPKSTCAALAFGREDWSEVKDEAVYRLAAAIGFNHREWIVGRSLHAIYAWNDDPRTTFEDVELAFKRAIAGEAL